MNLTIHHFLHHPMAQNSGSTAKNLTVMWLNRATCWMHSTMQNQAVAAVILLAINILVFKGNEWMMNTLVGNRDLDDNEALMGTGYVLYLHATQVFVLTRFLPLPFHPLMTIGLSVAVIAADVFRPDQWIYAQITG